MRPILNDFAHMISPSKVPRFVERSQTFFDPKTRASQEILLDWAISRHPGRQVRQRFDLPAPLADEPLESKTLRS